MDLQKKLSLNKSAEFWFTLEGEISLPHAYSILKWNLHLTGREVHSGPGIVRLLHVRRLSATFRA